MELLRDILIPAALESRIHAGNIMHMAFQYLREVMKACPHIKDYRTVLL